MFDSCEGVIQGGSAIGGSVIESSRRRDGNTAMATSVYSKYSTLLFQGNSTTKNGRPVPGRCPGLLKGALSGQRKMSRPGRFHPRPCLGGLYQLGAIPPTVYRLKGGKHACPISDLTLSGPAFTPAANALLLNSTKPMAMEPSFEDIVRHLEILDLKGTCESGCLYSIRNYHFSP